ncbi:MAG: ABC transporter permease [Burkholderiales bacterium]|nr:ABC transporter permease [Phycisphaerae bacterium]
MYKLHLILKYLRKRRIAWVSLIAVTLCTAMVLVVISVMGGWLETFKSKFRGMSGDIVVWRNGRTGFSGYEEMIGRIKALPEIEEALPLIRTFGLINIKNQIIEGVEVTGLDIERFSKFNSFRESLWRQYQKPTDAGTKPPDIASFGLLPDVPYELVRPGDKQARQRPGIIVGGPLVGMTKNKDGTVLEPDGLYEAWVRLEVVPISADFRSFKDAEPSANIYWIVDASRTQLHQLDSNSVYVPFDTLQRDLKMTARTFVNTETGQEETESARCNEIQIKLKPGADPQATVAKVRQIVESVQPPAFNPIRIETWDRQPQQEKFLNAVENEKLLITILFGVISVVAVFLIFCILYMIVVEKTRDIGIVKSVGATSGGVAAIFIGYGLAIGIVGASAGFVTGWIFLHYINEIHQGIARASGFYMWDPEIYAFDRIPNEMDPTTAIVVVVVAILSAVLGAVVPAIRAARLNPVEALRFE